MNAFRSESKKDATNMRDLLLVSRITATPQAARLTLASLELRVMKSRDHLIRLKRFQVEERRRRVAQIESMIADFNRMAADLDREIATEEQRSGITDPAHFAYPTYARAAVVRRDNLKRSADELRGQVEEARGHLEIAIEELKKVESMESRDKPDRYADPQRAEMDPYAMGRLARA